MQDQGSASQASYRLDWESAVILATFLIAKNFSLVGKHIWVQTWALKTERLRERERVREKKYLEALIENKTKQVIYTRTQTSISCKTALNR